MAIKPHSGPPNGRQVMAQALAARLPQSARALSTPLGGAPQTGSPVPVYLLPAGNVHDANPLAAARLVSWSYPVIGGMHPGLADVRENRADGSMSFGGLSYGVLARRFFEASALAEHALNKVDEEFEPRLLDCPALRFAALWLHAARSEQFVSLLDGQPPGSAPLQLTSAALADLRARAAASGQGAPHGRLGTPTN